MFRPYGVVLICVVCVMSAWRACAAGELPEMIRQALVVSGIPDNQIGLVVQDMESDHADLALGENGAFNPASVMKLVTTLAALDTLGPAHTFKTAVLTHGPIVGGVLEGDLILRGGGDPALRLERFWLLLREIKRRGIHEIRGDVLLDDGFYAIAQEDPGLFDAAPFKAYNAPPSALLVNFNTQALWFKPTEQGVDIRLAPASVPVLNQINLQDGESCNGWQDRLSLSYAEGCLRVEGVYPVACGERSVWLNLLPPADTVATYFKQLWQEQGGRLEGTVRVSQTPASAIPLLEFESEPLAELVRDINKFSNNVMAKMLYLNLGVTHFGGPATWQKSEKAVRGWLENKGMAAPELSLENGCGLSRIERLSASFMASLLIWAAHQPLYHEFAASLPALGLEGTLKQRMKATAEAGHGWLKTGSLNGTRNLAGYVLDANGRRKVLVLFINHANVAGATVLQESVLRWAISGSSSAP